MKNKYLKLRKDNFFFHMHSFPVQYLSRYFTQAQMSSCSWRWKKSRGYQSHWLYKIYWESIKKFLRCFCRTDQRTDTAVPVARGKKILSLQHCLPVNNYWQWTKMFQLLCHPLQTCCLRVTTSLYPYHVYSDWTHPSGYDLKYSIVLAPHWHFWRL